MESFLPKLTTKIDGLLSTPINEVPKEKVDDWKYLIDKIATGASTGQDLQARWDTYRKEKAAPVKNRGNEALASGDNEGAVLLFTIASLLEPENHIFFSNRSAAYCNLGKYKEALDDANKVVELSPQWPKGYSRKGAAHYFLRQFDDAYEAYQQGVKLEPGNELMQKSCEQAKNKVLAAEANVKGEQDLAKGKPLDAINSFDRAIKLDPEEFLYHSNRSEANLTYGYADRALRDADQTIALRPNWPKGYVRRGDALLRQNRFEDAASAYALASQLEPENPKHQKSVTQAIQEGAQYRSRMKFEEERRAQEAKAKEEQEAKEKADKAQEPTAEAMDATPTDS
eukprot:TRINITY_DN6069_c0_g1_i1.p1 TRINITY_DN6069_c0_g1~~TRINITY_DN6069_c0_g1_i1.p1  ORF type:complete len:364 (+),score=114.95 TRINITY_DN6069_c0_g1_i1:70-1092(+)